MAKPQVKQDQSGIWLAAPLAAKKLGLTKPELARLALAENLTFQEDIYGSPEWYLEPEIGALVKVHIEQARAKSVEPKKPKTERQIMRDIECVPSQPKKHGVAAGRQVQLTVPWGKGIFAQFVSEIESVGSQTFVENRSPKSSKRQAYELGMINLSIFRVQWALPTVAGHIYFRN